MRVLLDTNILGRLISPSDVDHAVARLACSTLDMLGDKLCITPQNLVELRNVATRPKGVNGMGMTSAEADAVMRDCLSQFPLLPETPDIFPNWKSIVAQSQVLGKQVHDARLVAVAVSAGVDAILTFNTTHFQRLCAVSGLQLLDQRAV